MRYAIVQRLRSGRTATARKHGQIEWCSTYREARDWVAMVSGTMERTGDACGYIMPAYELYCTPGVVKDESCVDKVVEAYAVAEEDWRAEVHHTIPSPIL